MTLKTSTLSVIPLEQCGEALLPIDNFLLIVGIYVCYKTAEEIVCVLSFRAALIPRELP